MSFDDSFDGSYSRFAADTSLLQQAFVSETPYRLKYEIPQYGRNVGYLMALHDVYPDLPIIVTEAGDDGTQANGAVLAYEYARFVRLLAQLPYVRAVDFFLLDGTPEWRGLEDIRFVDGSHL